MKPMKIEIYKSINMQLYGLCLKYLKKKWFYLNENKLNRRQI